ncbi:hypothetical protein AB7W11_16850 [Providencia manganoxydans]|uniref:capsular polysaccharide export protein, LipB/KpsS family n=1 Tax=Providencia manganoxydans TaxID=2923283 RepID=UPI0034E3E015
MTIKDILKKISSIFTQYSISPEEIEFIELNKKFWTSDKNTEKKSEKGILVEGFLDTPTSIIEKSRLAKAAEDVTKYSSIILVRGLFKKSSNVIPIYESFNFSNFILWWRNYFNPTIVIPALISSIYLYLFFRKCKNLINFKKDNVLIGDLIYDSLIRNIPNSYTIKKLKIITHSRILFRSMCFYHANKRLLKKNNIRVVVTSHNVYAEYGMLCRQAHVQGAIVILKDMDVYKIYKPHMNINEHFLKISRNKFEKELNKNSFIEEEKYFQQRIFGLSTQIDVKNAYKNKKKYTRYESISLKKTFDIKKKNIFIMSHAFSDAPHVGEGLLFQDYYDFLEKTLIYLNKNDKVNCFVKSHPSSYMWGEKGGVEHIIEKNNLNNICILPSDYNTSSIIESADVIVTAKGTAGIEFSCAGIPAITAGMGYYYGFGVCLEPMTINDYYKTLDLSHEIERLNQDKINRALVLLYHSFNNLYHSRVLPTDQIRPGDNYSSLYRKHFKEVSSKLNAGIPMKDEFYSMVINDLKDIHFE